LASRSILRAARRALACLLLVGLPTAAAAQAPRSLLDGLEGGAPPVTGPAVPVEAEGPQRIHVAGFEIEGNVSFTDAAMHRVLARFSGRDLTLDELREAVEAVLALYRDHGYRTARVSLPPQRIEEGLVRLVVRDDAVARADLDQAALGESGLALTAPGARAAAQPVPVRSGRQEPRAPGQRFYQALPSNRPHTRVVDTDRRAADRLVVELEEGRVRSFGAENDLFARLPDRAWRVEAGLQMANPAGRGGHLGARAVTDGNGLPFFSGHFETPLDAVGSTLDAPGRYLDEERVEDLRGRRADGRATALELAAERPLVDRPDVDLVLRARARHLAQIDQNQGRITAERRIATARLSTRGRLRDRLLGGGTTAASLSATLGHADLDGYEPYARADAAGARTAGAFGRWRAGLARLQSLGGPWSLFGSFTAQGASKNLDGSEKFAIGGVAPDRGFAVGEAFGDEGFRIGADLRYAVPARVLGGALEVALFYDQGAVRLRRRPEAGASNAVAHRAVGVALRQDWQGQGFLQVSAGRRIGGNLAEDQEPESLPPYRFWLRVGMNF
jgi:hemolysin activation/secretion protein